MRKQFSSVWFIIYGIGQVKYYTVTDCHEKIKILVILAIVLIVSLHPLHRSTPQI
jgi:hypothetical protein